MTACKNRGNHGRAQWKDKAIFASILLMIAGLFLSRAALSSSVILFLLLAILDRDFKKAWRRFSSNLFFPAFTLLFFLPFFSGLWSEDKNQWLDVVRLKLPLLFFPLAFAGCWQLTKRQWQWVALVFLGGVFAGCAAGLLHYAFHPDEVHAGYLRAKTLLTPLENDHVRFSWLVSVAVIGCFFFRCFFETRWINTALLVLAVFFVLYLHILSARTGLVSLYLFGLLCAGNFLLRKEKKAMSFLLVALLVSLPLLAYFFVPTFQNRIRYFVYDFSFVKKAAYLPGANDGARVMSLKAGWQVLKDHPLGVGAGDIMHEADKWYAVHVPQVLPTDKFYPSSEWLIHGAVAGWPGVLIFTFVMALPFFYQPKQHRLSWTAFHVTAAFSFLFDMGLEVQYGIFLYAFITFWWWRLASGE
ncbi:O-antigen ligase family protein [Flavisolibacter nicotianae]|uniref:O-antigen ligase family protein n=1 Tax=Flavisolibacter nicotianae TaxID=2364882 RepID=UPI0013C47ABD|nr:O-antigen ligase family protein [Flavisolibacter nicotianae]